MKRIVLLSDGTGNSAASPFKTNVWRTYMALDLTAGDQIAKYDDGVGTSSVKFLAAIGGAFGWGLKRNVLDLYKFLCRNYEPGDEIYGFGFSRGAFTIRVVMGLVLNQNLVRAYSEEELDLLARAAYRAYRADRYQRKLSLVHIGRAIRDFFIALRNKAIGVKSYDKTRNRVVASWRFIGVWDTVDAYGIPIKELKAGIDHFIWPLSFKDNKLHSKVASAYHALALDDERATFHPLVWEQESTEDRKRITQVWFPGMHADVGGGYPEDALAHVPLLWMIDQARGNGLVFKPATVAEYQQAASALGRMHDSRKGIGCYYRYSPRRLDTEGYPQPSEIHPCVQQRIDEGGDKYAPICVPHSNQQAFELTWDTVWWRRVAYWLMLWWTFCLVVDSKWPQSINEVDDSTAPLADILIGAVQIVAPSSLSQYFDALRIESPTVFLALVFLIVVNYLWGQFLAKRIRDRATEIWHVRPTSNGQNWLRQSKRRWRGVLAFAGVALAIALLARARIQWIALAGCAVLVSGAMLAIQGTKAAQAMPWLSLRFARALRTNRGVVAATKFLSHLGIPFVFALLVLATGIFAVNRASFEVMNLGGLVCRASAGAGPLAVGASKDFDFDARSPCAASGIILDKGAIYEISVVPTSPWLDSTIPVASLAGFDSGPPAPWYMFATVPLRRNVGESWFRPMAHIGAHSTVDRPLSAKTTLADIERRGELFVYVNDAVLGVPVSWDRFYENNHGTAKVTVTKTKEAEAED